MAEIEDMGPPPVGVQQMVHTCVKTRTALYQEQGIEMALHREIRGQGGIYEFRSAAVSRPTPVTPVAAT